MKQAMVLLKKGEKNPAAKAFYDYIQTDRAKAILTRYGYTF